MQSQGDGAKRDIDKLVERFRHLDAHAQLGDVQTARFGKLLLTVTILPRDFDQLGGGHALVATDAGFVSHYLCYSTRKR